MRMGTDTMARSGGENGCRFWTYIAGGFSNEIDVDKRKHKRKPLRLTSGVTRDSITIRLGLLEVMRLSVKG